MKTLLLILALNYNDSVKVKIIKVRGEKIVMKTLERPRVKFVTYCKCPFKRKEIVWIKN